MNKEDGIAITCALEDALNIPSVACEQIERKIEQGKYEEVLQFIANRWREIQRKKQTNKMFVGTEYSDFEQIDANRNADVIAWCKRGERQ